MEGFQKVIRLSGHLNCGILCTLVSIGFLGICSPAADAEKAQVIDKNSASSNAYDLSESQLLDKIVRLIQQCRYADAIPFSKRLVEVCTKDFGSEDPNVATVLNNLAFLYQQLGEYSQAEPLFLKALSIREKILGPDDADVALSLNNLALLYQDEGDYGKAEKLYQRSLKIKEKKFGAGTSELATEMNNLATLYKEEGDWEQAEKLFNTVLAIFEKKFGPDDSKVATVLNNLAGVYREKGDYRQAEALYERLMAIDKKALAPEHLDHARDLNNLAVLYFDEGKNDKAEALYLQALAIREAALGPKHIELITLLDNLAMIHLAKNDIEGALKFQTRANEISERSLSMILTTGSENQKRLYLDKISNELDTTLSMNVRFAPNNNEVTKLALGTILRRKGRVLDAVSHELLTLRHHLSEGDRKLLDELSSTRAELSALVLRGPLANQTKQYEESLFALEKQAQDLENEISRHSAAFGSQQKPVTVEQVQEAIPAQTALVEFERYRALDARAKSAKERFGPYHYVAYVLTRKGSPSFVDLGECAVIDKNVSELRSAIRKVRSSEYKLKSRELDKLLMQPVRALLKNTKTLFLSPDSTLNLVPFEALVEENGKFLIEDYSIDYLTSGRDLLRLEARQTSRQGSVIVANPLFGEYSAEAKSGSEQARIASMGIPFPEFKPLLGTAQEAEAISGFLPGARVLTGKEARKSVLKEIAGPRILHIATHGYFLPDELFEQEGTQDTKNRSVTIVAKSSTRRAPFENPLLRSGLAFAGANQKGNNADEDGLLTALEVSGLDLWGTRLVVLSACETGLGDIKQGEGVYGLRRALLIAGAETELVSLWPVSDSATATLMTDFYKRLISGQSRMESLREAQLKLLRVQNHPYYWAPFIPVGDWRAL